MYLEPYSNLVRDIINHKTYKWGIVFLITLFSILILYLNHLMPLVLGDDLLYKMKFPKSGFIGTDSINTLGDYFESQLHHFKNYNNRIAPHAVLQIVFLFGPWFFEILNTCIFLLLPYLMIKPFIPKSQNKDYSNEALSIYLVLLLLVWCFHYDLGRSYFWTTGSINYTWFLALQIYYLGRLYECLVTNDALSFGDLFIVFLISTSNENVVFSLFFLTIYVAYKIKQKNNCFNYKLLFACVLLLLGGTLMLLSPALQLKVQNEYIDYDSFGIRLTEYLMRLAYYSLLSLPLLLVLVVFKVKASYNKVFFLLTIGIASLVMILPPLYEPRSSIFVFFVIGMLLISCVEITIIKRYWPIIILMLYTVTLFNARFKAFKTNKERYHYNINILENSNNESIVVLPKFCISQSSNVMVCDDLSKDTTMLENKIAAKYFKKQAVLLNTKHRDEMLKSFISICEQKEITANSNYSKAMISKGSEDINKVWLSRQELVVELKDGVNSEGFTFILRGANRHNFKHQLIKHLPLSLQIYLLDLLEAPNVTVMECSESNFTYNYIENLEDYNYILWSKYDKRNHKAKGEITRIQVVPQ